MISHDDIERIRAELDLAPVDPEEADTTFVEPHYLNRPAWPIVGVDYVDPVGPILVRYEPQSERFMIQSKNHFDTWVFHAEPGKNAGQYRHAIDMISGKAAA